MKALTFLILCFASIAFADDFKTIDGKEYKNATVSRVEADGIVLITSSGIWKVYFKELPKEVQERFHYGRTKVENERAAAIEKQRAGERQRAEKEHNAEENLMKSGEQFEAAENRAAQSYKNSEKGILSGQVFVATKGGENIKFGAVKISLFARDAIDVLLAELKAFADGRIEQLRSDMSAAAAEEEQAKAAEEQAKAIEEQPNAAEERAKVAEEQAKVKEEQAKAEEAQAKVAEKQAEATEKKDLELYRGGFATTDGLGAVRAAREEANASREAQNAAGEAENAAREARSAAREAQKAAQEAQKAASREAQNAARNAANAARKHYSDLLRQQNFYYSQAFYFSHLRSSIQSAETDGDGKFVIEVPRTGTFIIAAQAERSVGKETDSYYWLQPVSLEGQQQRVQNLSNSNLRNISVR